jgi:hypothetical protein
VVPAAAMNRFESKKAISVGEARSSGATLTI